MIKLIAKEFSEDKQHSATAIVQKNKALRRMTGYLQKFSATKTNIRLSTEKKSLFIDGVYTNMFSEFSVSFPRDILTSKLKLLLASKFLAKEDLWDTCVFSAENLWLPAKPHNLKNCRKLELTG